MTPNQVYGLCPFAGRLGTQLQVSVLDSGKSEFIPMSNHTLLVRPGLERLITGRCGLRTDAGKRGDL
jgi:hypothetical protein